MKTKGTRMPNTTSVPARVTTSPLLWQVVETDSEGRKFVTAAFDVRPDAEMFATIRTVETLRDFTVREEPEHAALREHYRELRRPIGSISVDEVIGL